MNELLARIHKKSLPSEKSSNYSYMLISESELIKLPLKKLKPEKGVKYITSKTP